MLRLIPYFLSAQCIPLIFIESGVGRDGLKTEGMHGLTLSDVDTMLHFLRCIDNSPSPTSTDLPVDYHYQKHIDSLKSGNIWKKNLQLREWLLNKWLKLSCPQVSTIAKPHSMHQC